MGVIVLAAGGTGGHLFPAQALAEELTRRGHVIHLMTDERVRDYGKNFSAQETHVVPSATLSLRDPWLLPGRMARLAGGFGKARSILKRTKPSAVVGFGGYPSFPPLVAAWQLRIPTIVHDSNAIMGRANRLLAGLVTAVASSFPELQGLPPKALAKLVVTGNPVRDAVLREQASPYPSRNGQFNLLVFGGSQGARFFAEFMPRVVDRLSTDFRGQIKIVQQCRPEDLEGTRAAYAPLGFAFELQPFFTDMPKRIAAAHLVICRSGASTIAELGVIGRPAIMVPLPGAIDQDQLRNAESFAKAGAGWIRPQANADPSEIAEFLTRLSGSEPDLTRAAAAALSHGRPDAALRLAGLTEKIATRDTT